MSPAACSVSVLIPAYNSASTLPRAVRSVLTQSFADLELIIINDGSTDATGEVAAGLAATDARVRVMTLSRNRGKPFAMNTGIARAAGRWIAVLDADDWYAPERLSVLLGIGEQQSVDLVADNQFSYDDGAEQVVRTALPTDGKDGLIDKAAFIIGSDPYADFDYGMLKPVVRTDFVRAHNLGYREDAKLSEDFLYLLEFLAAGGRVWLTDRPMYYWTQAFGTISRRWTETGNGGWRYDYLSAIAANTEVLKEMRSAGEPELAELLQQRIRAFHQLYWIQRLSRMRAEGASPVRLAGTVFGHPFVWPLIARRGVRRFAKLRPLRSLVRA